MKRILIIEDDKSLCQTLSLALRSEDFDVVSTGDGEEGLKLAIKALVKVVKDLNLDRIDAAVIRTDTKKFTRLEKAQIDKVFSQVKKGK